MPVPDFRLRFPKSAKCRPAQVPFDRRYSLDIWPRTTAHRARKNEKARIDRAFLHVWDSKQGQYAIQPKCAVQLIRNTKLTTTNERCAYVRRHLIIVAATGTGSKPTAARIMAMARDDDMTAAMCDTRRRTQARELLAPVYGALTEGFERPDLLATKALLASLG
jgi:hypothetical protein